MASKNREKLVIGTIYRHPSAQYSHFSEKLCKTIELLNRTKTKYLLVGDINIDILKYNLVSNVTNYINALNSVGCSFHVDKPTRVTANTSSCIDHVYSNMPTSLLHNYIVLSDVSDHFGIITKLYNTTRYETEQPVYYRKKNLSDAEWNQFNRELHSILHQKFLFANNDDINACESLITSTYNFLINKYMPQRKLSRKQKSFLYKPWITKGMKVSIKRKNKLYKRSVSCSESIAIQNYKIYRAVLTKIKIQAKQNYYSDLAVRYGNNKSKTWRLINDISKRKQRTKGSIKALKNRDGNKLTNPVDIANCLNTHFSSVGESMAEKIKTLDSDKDPLDYISCNVKHPANLSLTNEKEISDLVKSLKNKKACGYDLISNRILKETRKTIVPFITSLFNKCLSSGIFPESFKIAQVVPLFKGGDKENPTSYRPISLLPALGKLLEKLVSVRTLNFFNENDILSKHQFGFRKSFSTEFAILDIYEKLLYNLDKNVNSCAIFLDLAKAFDSVDHSILLRKLSRYGIDGAFFNFFKSYLENRSQFVKLDNVKSSILSIKYGVPQGSILGPLLFLIFINDLPNATNFFIKLFADDTFLCAQNADFQSLETEVNIEIQKVFQWLISNKLTLNIAKSKFMIISNSKSKPERFQISLNDSQLEECDKYKYLGVIIDKNLSWKPHVEYISGKISKACGALAKLRHCIGTNVLVEIYHALIHSYVRYGILA